jgi:hypothetical protein
MAASESKIMAEAMKRLTPEERFNLPKNLNTHKKLTAAQKGAFEKLKSIKAQLEKEGWGTDAQDDFKEADLEAQKIVEAQEEKKAIASISENEKIAASSSIVPEVVASSIGGKDLFLKLRQKYAGDAEKAFFEYCFRTDLIYDRFAWNSIVSQGSEYADDLPESYETLIKNDPKYEDKTFFGQIKLSNFIDLTQDDLVEDGLTEQDKEHRTKIIKITGYDPFLEYSLEDRPGMYRSLATMLTEDMKNDVPKQKSAISMVQNYTNLDKYQRKLRLMAESGTDDTKDYKDLSDMVVKMQTSLNQTGKENNFTGSKALSGGKGTLSSVMDKINQDGIDSGQVDYYDIKTSSSFRQVSEESFHGMLDQVKLQDSDYKDVLAGQCKLVREATKVAWEAREELRLLKAQIKKQALLDELAQEYLKKGLSLKDVNDYLDKEYILHPDLNVDETLNGETIKEAIIVDKKNVVSVKSVPVSEDSSKEEKPAKEKPKEASEDPKLPNDW